MVTRGETGFSFDYYLVCCFLHSFQVWNTKNSFHWLCSLSGEGNDNSLQYPCLENPMDRGAWQATVHGVEFVRIVLKKKKKKKNCTQGYHRRERSQNCFLREIKHSNQYKHFPDGLVVKNPPAHAGDLGSIPGSGEGNGNPLWCSCLGNPMDRGIGQLQSMGSQRVGHSLATKQ